MLPEYFSYAILLCYVLPFLKLSEQQIVDVELSTTEADRGNGSFPRQHAAWPYHIYGRSFSIEDSWRKRLIDDACLIYFAAIS